ncbi:MAG TPA: hypothetical protein VFP10_03215, partial [Candidatus Eisenbacteria bacterium]|nr:hypothetical protein [Candidatus Eisenbacteria bacterium]
MPTGLPSTFSLGVTDGDPSTLAWIEQTRSQSGSCWDMHYQYMTGGVNTGQGWETWNEPRGQFATEWMNRATSHALIPVMTYYEIVPSTPNAYDESKTLAKLQNNTLMRDYFENLELLLRKINARNVPVILHVEPDMWGTIHASVFNTTNHPASVPVSVASTGDPLLSGFANNAVGFAQAIASLRNQLAPKAILAIHWSHWANNDLDHCSDCSQATVEFELARTIEFYNRLMTPLRWDLFFSDPDDRDA